ncbi:crotonase/enoyl-CoA hydratase family protein [Streptantibioticus cattleyicolor]|uniref:Enoyl-CoA hydratase n=1 Tax=Streptantibioticus cattleyicolor (strain ATCC 35852 / DSM 46488 / JCM 4925 / NBRC 14057 / NRRL 8057) TaxID=1003195 RepID=F8JMC8_STREN|nr:crotonase/enoyl-CoA hydratase family protein [Streptantibioticus cattleyicolor]AEW99176.1 enoyl-CoA hydratase [Streptantibioticus cattleyicolor NRRL 8057 = DSM 46488]CCB71782.1 Carnitinyl-CoA dehydratase [Streptantibioticus cattleyicolor NRRL 8057 = DSM 46488]
MSQTPTADDAPVLTEERDGVLLITLNRPHAKNAVDRAMAQALAAALDRLTEESALRAGVLTGAGGDFSAGMDLKAFARGETPVLPGRGFGGLTRATLPKPLVAAVEGWALGGGTEMVLACDLVTASTEARFGLPEVTRGIVAPEGGLLRLPQRIPRNIAAELLLTGAPLTAPRAAELGLVNRLTDPGGAVAAALELASATARNAPLSIAAVKHVLHEAVGMAEADAFRLQDEIIAPVLRSEDAAEGPRAFAEKRPPRWRGR